MSRVIKFRATLKGKIVAYIRISPDEDGNMHTSWNTTNEGGWIFGEPPRHDTLDSFTGLLDTNGKKIFGGDIVQCDVRIEGRTFKKARGEVMYGDNVAAFCVMLDDDYGSVRTGPSSDGSRYALTMEQLFEFIVIGNIYENPKLLGA